MSKPIIAVDIDNVLAVHTEVLMEYYNALYGTHHSPAEYDESWAWMGDEGRVADFRVKFPRSGMHRLMKPVPGAKAALLKLKQEYDLAIITARWDIVREITLEWVGEHFPETFKEVHFAQTWATGQKVTKADICRQIAAEYLIDDNISHCTIAAKAGIPSVLFGDYPWNQASKLHKGVVRCKDWAAVLEYFDAIRN